MIPGYEQLGNTEVRILVEKGRQQVAQMSDPAYTALVFWLDLESEPIGL